MPMLNKHTKIPIRDWFIMHSRTDSESATCYYYSPPTHLPLHPGYAMIGGTDSTTTANTNICHEMNTGCSMFTNPKNKKTSPTSANTNNSYDMSDTADYTDMKSSEDFILVSPSFPDLSLSTSLDDIDVSGHGDDMDDDSIDLDMLSISSVSPPLSTIRLAARPRSFSPSNSVAFTPSAVPRVSPIKELSTLFSSTGLNTFTPIQVQDDNHDDTTTKTSLRKSPYLW